MTQTLADLGESGLLKRIFALLPVGTHTVLGPGDDAAVVAAPDGRVVATTDMLVEDRDFRRDWSSAADVGWKAAAQNLADIAAMGAVPTALLVGLAAPSDTEVAWALQMCEGLAAACAGTGVGVVGGDLSAASQIVVSVTALGDLQGRQPLLRSGARPGDAVAVAGRLGCSAAGLALLQLGRQDLSPSLVQAHQRPRPPYDHGPAAADAGATAMLDVSDGLLRDVGRIAAESAVTVDLFVASDPDLDAVRGGRLAELREALRPTACQLPGDSAEVDRRCTGWVLTGGEDHSLLATFPADAVLPEGFEVIGAVLPRLRGWPPVVLDGSGTWDGAVGWDHFGG